MPEAALTAPRGLTFAVDQRAPVPLQLRLHCPAGQLLALCGPSGSGKTTLLRLLIGLERPGGLLHMACDQQDWLDTRRGLVTPTRALPLGLVFQNGALFPHLNALQHLLLALHDQPAATRSTQAAAWLERVQLSHRAQAFPATLSGGEQQRLALARALARQPRALLLDEPFAAIDQSLRRSLYLLLGELCQQLALSIVLVTHEIREALDFADQLALLDRGQLLQVGTPAELLASPASEAVAERLGLENYFAATLSAQGEVHWAEGSLWPAHVIAPGPVWLHCPPEQVQLTAAAGSGWPGRVEQCARLGGRYFLRLRLPAGSRLHAIHHQSAEAGSWLSVELPAHALRLSPQNRHVLGADVARARAQSSVS